MKRTVVCISHATGAGGSEVGRLVAERLGFWYVDEDILAHAAAKGGVDPDALADEERRKSWLARVLGELAGGATGEAWAVLGPMTPVPDQSSATSEELRALIREAIEETAAQGKVVIVAHAASHAIGGRKEALRVLVTGSPETRAERLRESDRLNEAEAGRAVKEADAARADYLRRFHEVDEERPTHYDLVVNTDQLSVEQAAELVSSAASQ
jgi:cytidylate kinase